MSHSARLYTPAEAGAVSGLNLKAVHNAIDKHMSSRWRWGGVGRPASGGGCDCLGVMI